MTARKVRHILDTIAGMFPDARCELNHNSPFELTIAVLLSAQCTDETVNKVTATLFQKYKTPQDYLRVPVSELENDIRRIGLFRNKAANIQKLCRLLIERHGGEVPSDHAALTALPGVGRKTANVVVSNAFGVPAIAVDTHVERVSKRLGLADEDDSVLEVEKKLMKKVPRDEWTITHHRLIFFGRYHCKAQNPNCAACPLIAECKVGKARLAAAGKGKAAGRGAGPASGRGAAKVSRSAGAAKAASGADGIAAGKTGSAAGPAGMTAGRAAEGGADR
jgi:endonuclease-3